MAAGYALLPTLASPTSHLTYRLTAEEMQERNAWILGAHARGMSYYEIAYEVGLGYHRVREIVKASQAAVDKKKPKFQRFATPMHAALDEFWRERAHPGCSKVHYNLDFDGFICNDCFGRSMIVQCEYDTDGWPHDWAMYDQEKYIQPHMIRP